MVVLLHTGTLVPQGPSLLAAVRFSQAVRVSSIRIFPKGAHPFEQAQDIVASTQPATFYVDLFFNATPFRPSDADKHRLVNALVSTAIAYTGGHVDFAVDMPHATRLIIFKGTFEKLTLAIYGDLVTEPSQILAYHPGSLVLPQPNPLSKALDPANASDPTILARNLLALIPHAPSLSLAIRLMFCLKPVPDDWKHPDFPYLYADLQNDGDDYDLASVLESLRRPIPEDVPLETLDRFVERLNEFVGPPNIEQAYQIANALNISASQDPHFTQALLTTLDLPTIFDSTTLVDASTLLLLIDAASNALIARHFLNTPSLLNTINELCVSRRMDKSSLAILRRFKTRLEGWKAFEDVLSNTHDDYLNSTSLIQDIGRDEQALGNWLETMIADEDVSVKLSGNLVLPGDTSASLPPVLFDLLNPNSQQDIHSVSRDQFILFVRACVAVASVLAVLAWADSVGNDACRERTLAVVYLWQGVDGYREIVNHFLLLRQLTRRLRWIITESSSDNVENDSGGSMSGHSAANHGPRKSGQLAEKVLFNLTLNPAAFLNEELTKTVLALSPDLSFDGQQDDDEVEHWDESLSERGSKHPSYNQPTPPPFPPRLSYISDTELLCLRKLALVADDGVPAAVEELISASISHQQSPFSLRRLKIVRVAIALVSRALSSDAVAYFGMEADPEVDMGFEMELLESFWRLGETGFVGKLVELYCQLSQDLSKQFSLPPQDGSSKPVIPNSPSAVLVDHLFCTAHELLVLLVQLARLYPFTKRDFRELVEGLVEVLAYIYATDNKFVGSMGKIMQKVKEECLDFLEKIGRGKGCSVGELARSESGIELREGEKECARVVFKALLELGKVSGNHATELRLKLVLSLVDLVLPNAVVDADKGEDEEGEGSCIPSFWVTSILPNALSELRAFFRMLTPEDRAYLMRRLVGLDRGITGIGEWILMEEMAELRDTLVRLGDLLHSNLEIPEGPNKSEEDTYNRILRVALNHRVYLSLQFLWDLVQPESDLKEWFFEVMDANSALTRILGDVLGSLLEGWYMSPALSQFVRACAVHRKAFVDTKETTMMNIMLSLLRFAQADPTSPGSSIFLLDMLNELEDILESGDNGISIVRIENLRREISKFCLACAEHSTAMNEEAARMVFGMLKWLDAQKNPRWKILRGVTPEALTALFDSLSKFLQPSEVLKVADLRNDFTIESDPDTEMDLDLSLPYTELPSTLRLSLRDTETLLRPRSHSRPKESGFGSEPGSRPSTPMTKGTKTPDILGTIISPPTSILRSPAATGLTKTYANNDFRQLRAVPSARLNTSRMPSTHVDDFENGVTSTVSVSPLVVPLPMPVTDVSTFGGLLNMG